MAETEPTPTLDPDDEMEIVEEDDLEIVEDENIEIIEESDGIEIVSETEERFTESIQGSDRRREYRLSKVLGAEIDQAGEVLKARLFVINISRSGFRATNESALPQGVELTVKLFLQPKEAPIEARGQIVWVKELTASGMFDHGFEFSYLSEEHWATLTDFIESERTKVETKTLDLTSPWAFRLA